MGHRPKKNPRPLRKGRGFPSCVRFGVDALPRSYGVISRIADQRSARILPPPRIIWARAGTLSWQ